MKELLSAIKSMTLRDFLDGFMFVLATAVWCCLLWMIGG